MELHTVSPLLFFLTITILSQGQNGHGLRVLPPIPLLEQDPGIPYYLNSTSGAVKLEVFLDLQCRDSAAVWPVLRQVAEHYGPERLNLVVHPMVLPYHPHAFILTQALYYVQDRAPARVFDYIDVVFSRMSDFSRSTTHHKSPYQILNMVANIGYQATGLPARNFQSWISYYYRKAVLHWKYSVRRGVAGTPWYFINHVDLGINPSLHLRLEDWRHILDPLITRNTIQG